MPSFMFDCVVGYKMPGFMFVWWKEETRVLLEEVQVWDLFVHLICMVC